ncbi:MAG: FprA family A-type flavoprotein, partial [Bacteroidales bacterium]|nr:FprA family A-type flavoprotein [Bacteroidales bacterium]
QNRVFAVAENGTWAPTAGKQMREMLAFNNNVITDTTLTIKSALNESQSDSVDKFVNEILNK